MNVLETRGKKELPGAGRLFDAAGQRFEWAVAQKPRGSSLQSGAYVAYVIICTDSASVGGQWGKPEDKKSYSVDPEEFRRTRMWEYAPFFGSDLQADICNEDEGSTSEISAFLDTVYDFAKRDKEDHAIDVILEYMNNLLVEGQFEACDRILGEVDIARIPPVLMVSFLTITAAAKTRLKNRNTFLKVVRRVVARERGEKAAERLLDGLD